MNRSRGARTRYSALSTRYLPIVLVGVALALLPGAAFAQEVDTPDRDAVMLWTAIVSLLALAVCAVGYMYRRARGMDHPTPDELEMAGGHGHDSHDGHDDDAHADRDRDDLAVPAHPESEHPAHAHH